MLTYQSYNNATNWGGVGRIKYKFIINGKEFDGDTRLVRPDFILSEGLFTMIVLFQPGVTGNNKILYREADYRKYEI
ncbi:hypothetical protein SIO70_25350 [Chitinophaga sancti]|uniref:hypothetical protein n=1 Tax=Chitinophaga sancti TaxID=1004 RepID=UPI002A74B4C3|nr:hypothetical protein [Chitinophaga sancti]WPQ61691.1 hypothetical protein SIO70_25350 [Chitinophaga sancti]